jgi:signal transduction histidine kinase/GAF domain-containing protein
MSTDRANAMLAAEAAILERVAQSLPVGETLEATALLVEEFLAGCCGILGVGAGGATFHMLAGTGLARRFASFHDGKAIDAAADPCSLAVQTRKPVIAVRPQSDAAWRGSAWARLLARHGFASCWSMPVVSDAGEVMGVCFFLRRAAAAPAHDELVFAERFVRIVRFAMQRAQLDAALLAQQTQLRHALGHLTQAQRLSHTGSFTTDVEADEHVWSDELYRVLEFAPGSKVKFQSFRALIHADDLPAFDAGFRRALAEGTDFDQVFRIVTPKGRAKHLHAVSHFSESTAGHRIVAGSIQDVTASRNAAEALKAREAELHRAMAQLAEGERLGATGSFTSDIHRDRHNWSAEFYRIFQIDPATQPNVLAIRDRVHAEDLALFDSEIQRGMDGHGADFMFRIVTPEGGLKHLRGVARLIDHAGGRPIFMGTVQDISERKTVEEARDRARSELAHVARVAALGALTASIAHEVNQPLAGIVTNASTCLRMLDADPSDTEGAKTTVRRTIRDANRAAEVIKRLRALFAGKPMQKCPVDLNDALREVLSLTLGELQKRRVVLHTELAADPPMVLGDRVQLQQVMLNLVLNACEALQGVDDHAREVSIATLRDERQVMLSVGDTGAGSPADHLEQMFNAFYSTKSGGMGVGLSVSRSIVEAHGGELVASVNDGPGLTFAIYMPVAS